MTRPHMIVTDPASGVGVAVDAFEIASRLTDPRARALAASVVRRGQVPATGGQREDGCPICGHHRPDEQVRLLDPRAAARRLGVSLRTLRRRVAAGDLPAVRDGRLVRFRLEDLQRYIEERRQ